MLAKNILKTLIITSTALLISACGNEASKSQPNQIQTQPSTVKVITSKKVNPPPATQTNKVTNIAIQSLIFTDAKLANCVQQQAKQNRWQHSGQMTKLSCANKSIDNLGGLQNLTHLQQLNLSQNEIATIAPLENLTQLKKLNLAGNQIVDIKPLANLTKLTDLNLGPANKLNTSTNSIRDLSPIANLTALQKLDASYNQISDISVISSLINLVSLQLNHNQIRDIGHLQALNLAHSSNLSGNDNITCAALNELETNLYQGKLQRPNDCLFTLDILIVDINISDQQLKNCVLDTASHEGWITISEVTNLSCEQHNIHTLNGIENLKALTQLDLSDNQIVDITPLLVLNTTQIKLTGNSQIACTRLNALEAAIGQHAIERPSQCAQLSLLSDVDFADVALEACVQYTANLYQWQTINEMTSLLCPNELKVKITMLDDLQQLSALNSIHIGEHLSPNLNCQTLEYSQRQLDFDLSLPSRCN